MSYKLCFQRTLAIESVVKHDGINVDVIHPRLNGKQKCSLNLYSITND